MFSLNLGFLGIWESRDLLVLSIILLMLYIFYHMILILIPEGTHKYIGEKNKLKQPHGKGKLIGHNGDIYNGNFFNGKMHGYGEYHFKEGGGYYKGEFKNGEYSGNGIEKYSNGNVFIGTFLKGLRDGSGRMNYGNGSWYQGDWKAGARCGKGVYYNKTDMVRYAGYWKDSKQHGQGELRRKVDGIWLVLNIYF